MTAPLGRWSGSVWLRRLAWLLVAWLLLWALLWLAVPPLARWLIERQGSQLLGRQVSLERVEFSPWSLQATLRGLRVASADGAGVQLQVDSIEVDGAIASLWRLAPVIDGLKVSAPLLKIAQLAPGQWDFDDVLERLKSKPEEKDPNAPLPRFALYNLSLQDGAMEFDDRSVGAVQQLRKLHVDIPFLSSFDAARQIKVQPRLAFELNDSAFDSAAQSTPFTPQAHTQARLHMADLDLSHFARYIPASAPLRLAAGRLTADVQVEFAQQPQQQLQLRGQLQLRDVQTTQANGQPWLDVKTLDVAVADLRPLEQRLALSNVAVQGLHLRLQRAANGQLWLPGAAQPADKSTAGGAAANSPAALDKAAPAWQVQVGRVTLHESRIDWQDASLSAAQPPAWSLRQLQAQASDIAWPLEQAVPFALKAQVQRNAATGAPTSAPAAQLGVEGRATLEQAQLALSLRNLPIEQFQPYLAGVLKPRLSGTLDVDVGLAKNGDKLALQLASLTLERLALQCLDYAQCPSLRRAGVSQAGKDTLLELARLELSDSLLDLSRQQLSLGRVRLQQPLLQVARSSQGDWLWQDWLVATTATSQGAAAPRPADQTPTKVSTKAPTPDWRIRLAQLQVDGAGLAWREQVNNQAVALNLAPLQLQVKGLEFAQGQLGKTAVLLDTRIAAGRAEPGRLRWDGSVAMAPQLQAQGKLLLHNVPLHRFEPYVAPLLNVQLQRADGSFDGDLHYQAKAGKPWLRVQGHAALDDVLVRAGGRLVAKSSVAESGAAAADSDAAADESQPLPRQNLRLDGDSQDLLRWKSLGVRGLTLALEPDKPLALQVQETALSDFFARVILQENGRINLQDIVKTGAEDAASTGATAKKEAGKTAASVAAESGSQPASNPAPGARPPNAAQLQFGPVKLVNGVVHFSDYFIKPNYSVDVTELNGQLSAFANTDQSSTDAPPMADLQLRGRAQGTAQLDITGKLNPLASPLALDIQARMRDLELPPLSTYSIKYAGHGIERGKLSMDVAYQVQADGKLTARNKLVLHQLAFGDEVKGAPASLPVRLAVALLADRNGVIDVDLPISGSLNDPEFRLGAVIFKVIGNLIMKAITAPFSLLAGVFGGADEQGAISFAPGSAQLSEATRVQLDKLAQELNNRPALQVTVSGWAQPQTEAEAAKELRLRDLLLAQKRRDAQRAGQAVEGVSCVTNEEYPALLKRVYQRADFKKPRNAVGLAKDLPQAQMQALLLQNLELPANAMNELALARAVAVRDYLAAQKVPLERLFVGASKLQEPAVAAFEPRVELSLGAK